MLHHTLSLTNIARSRVTGMIFSPDSKILAIASSDGKVLLFDIRKNEVIAAAKLDQEPGTVATALVWRRMDDFWVGSSEGRVSKWTVLPATKSVLLTDFFPKRFDATVSHLDHDPVSRRIVVSHNGTVECWVYEGGDWVGKCQMVTGAKAILGLKFCSAGMVLVCSSTNCCLWDPCSDKTALPLVSVQVPWDTVDIVQNFVAMSGGEGLDVYRVEDNDDETLLVPMTGVFSTAPGPQLIKFLPCSPSPILVSNLSPGKLDVVWSMENPPAVGELPTYPREHRDVTIAVGINPRTSTYQVAVASAAPTERTAHTGTISLWSSGSSPLVKAQVLDANELDVPFVSIGGALEVSIQAKRMIRRTVGSLTRLQTLHDFLMKEVQSYLSPQVINQIPSIRKRYILCLITALLTLGYAWYTPPASSSDSLPKILKPVIKPTDETLARSSLFYLVMALVRLNLDLMTWIQYHAGSLVGTMAMILAEAFLGLGQLFCDIVGTPLSWIGVGSFSLYDYLASFHNTTLHAACLKAGTAADVCAKQYGLL